MENRQIKVLIINNLQDNLISLKVLINKTFPDATVFTTLTSEKGFEITTAQDPDLVLIDIVMPSMDRFELCRKLKADKKLSDIPVVFITANKDDKQSRILALESGAEAFLTKPIDEYELITLINAMVKIKNANIQKRFIPIFDENGKHIRNTGNVQDIIDQRKAEAALIESEAHYHLIADNVTDMITKHSLDAIYTFVSPSSKRILGYEPEELIGVNPYDLFHPESISLMRGYRNTVLSTSDVVESTYRIRHKNGSYVWLETTSGTIRDRITNEPKEIICVSRDITERKRMYDSLNEALKFNQDIISSANEGVVVYDTELCYKLWNPFMEKITGLSSQVVLERKATDVFPWLEEIGAIDNLKKALKGEVLIERDFPYNIAETNCSGWVRTNNGPLYNSKGKIIGVLGTVQNITERKKAEDKLIYYSYHDQLTGLCNRRYLEEELSRLDTEHNLPITIVMCDLNGLKMINDSLGHAVGDSLIRKAAEVIKKVCRADDIIARVGGDEFIMLLPKTSGSDAVCIIERIKELVSKEKVGSVALTIAFGYETKINSGDSILEVRANAENDMYRHKLYERGSTRSKIIDMIMNTLYEKSDREMFHSKRVSEICEAIAGNLQFDEDNINQIRMAGLLHDIGKIGVHEQILNKDQQLNDDEWEQIKEHPEGGWRILNAVNEFSELANFVLEHHERWDGTGYPNGLKGEEISIQSRIIAVADAYDAMTSERSYRKALSKEKAINEIKNNAGFQFDPDIARVFIEKVI